MCCVVKKWKILKTLAYFKLIRPKQWSKNVFVFVPLFFSGEFQVENVNRAILGFFVFCTLCSAIYVLNDWFDIEADRQHKKKRTRPLASGLVFKKEASFLILLLFLMTICVCFFQNYSISTLAYLVFYGVLNIAYSLRLKHIPILELFILASGFIVRLLFGAAVVEVTLSLWIIICTGLLSLMLAIGKRRGDLVQNNDGKMMRKSLTYYNLTFLDQINVLSATTTFTGYLIFCTTSFAINRFGQEVIITAVFVLFGILSYLRLLILDEAGDDPTSLVLGDNGIRIAILFWIISFAILIYF